MNWARPPISVLKAQTHPGPSRGSRTRDPQIQLSETHLTKEIQIGVVALASERNAHLRFESRQAALALGELRTREVRHRL